MDKETLLKRIESDFTYHNVSQADIEKMNAIRSWALSMARLMVSHCPIGRELSLALTHLEDAVYCANASIARNE